MNLKVGDILEQEGFESLEVIELLGKLVALKEENSNEITWFEIADLGKWGWKLKKTEEKNPCYVFNGIACQECTKEKTIVKPKQIYFDLYSDDEYNMVTTTIREYFSTKEQAEAYRSELIERNK